MPGLTISLTTPHTAPTFLEKQHLDNASSISVLSINGLLGKSGHKPESGNQVFNQFTASFRISNTNLK
jgi:hypothetical protein